MSIRKLYRKHVFEVLIRMTQEERRWLMTCMALKKELYKSKGQKKRANFCYVATQVIMDIDHFNHECYMEGIPE